MGSSAFDHLTSLLSPTEVISRTSPLYITESQPWAVQRDLKPTLLIRPQSLESLSKAIAYLSTTELDFKVRSQGFGNASAKDVLISLSAFDGFEFDRENEVVTLGAGQHWGSYYEKMEKVAPEYAVVACRTPSIGVGGSTLCGGFSWLSGEFGCVSDPANMLDAQVVKLDGSVVWASEEPELLWALRGTETGFGVVTAFKFRTRRYTQSVWAGPILLPRNTVFQVAKGIVAMDKRKRDPKVAMFLYVMRKELLKFIGADDDMLVVHAYDALGEEHGRSEAGFKWALDLPGAVDSTKVMNLRGVAKLQEHIGELKGTAKTYWTPVALPTLTEDIILDSFKWFRKGLAAGGSIADNGYLLFELFCCRDQLGSSADSAWPRPRGYKHMVLLGAGCAPDSDTAEEEKAKTLVKDGPQEIMGEDAKIDIVPNALEDFHDVKMIYGEHYSKLQELKRQYDPDNKLKGPIRV